MNFVALRGVLAEPPTRQKQGRKVAVFWKVRTEGIGGTQIHRVVIWDSEASTNLSKVRIGEPVLVAGFLGRSVYQHEGKEYRTTEVICDPVHGYEIWFGSTNICAGRTNVFPTWNEWVADFAEDEPEDEDDPPA